MGPYKSRHFGQQYRNAETSQLFFKQPNWSTHHLQVTHSQSDINLQTCLEGQALDWKLTSALVPRSPQ